MAPELTGQLDFDFEFVPSVVVLWVGTLGLAGVLTAWPPRSEATALRAQQREDLEAELSELAPESTTPAP